MNYPCYWGVLASMGMNVISSSQQTQSIKMPIQCSVRVFFSYDKPSLHHVGDKYGIVFKNDALIASFAQFSCPSTSETAGGGRSATRRPSQMKTFEASGYKRS